MIGRRGFLKTSLSFAGLSGLSGGLAAPFVSRAAAQTGPLTLIVPGPEGSRSGIVGRTLGRALQQEAQRPVEVVAVENPREGYLMLAAAAPNGSTIGLIGADMPALNRGIGGSPPVGSVAPIALIAEDPAGIHVRADAPWRSAAEVAAHIRAQPGSLKASGAGRHAVWHLSAQRWVAASRVPGAPLPWDAAASPAEAAGALVAGGPDIVICSVPEVRSSPAGKRIRTLAIMSPSRNPRYPDVAALGETGVGLRAGWWRGVVAPAGADPRFIAQMQASVQLATASASYRQELTRRGFRLTWQPAGSFRGFLAAEDRAVAAAVRTIG